MRRSTSAARRACAVGTTIALIGLSTGLGLMTATSASAAGQDPTPTTQVDQSQQGTTGTDAGSASDTGSPAADTGSPASDTGSPASDDDSSEPGSTTTTQPAAPQTQPAAPETNSAAPGSDPAVGASPATDVPAPTQPRTPARIAAASGTVTIDGTASVGSTLTAEPTGFTAPAVMSYEWTVDGVSVSQAQTYVVKAEDGGKVVTVTATNTQGGVAVESASAKTAAVTQAPAFVDEDGTPITAGTTDDGDDLVIDATAGERFSYTFRTVGYPKPTLALAFYYAGDDEDHEGGTPADQLPEGVSFDPSTGVLSGSTKLSSDFTFAVTATSGRTTITQTVDLFVAAGAPVGIEATAVDRQAFIDFAKSGFPDGWFSDGGDHAGTFTDWIIKADGSIVTEEHQYSADAESGEDFSEQFPGGTPTVPQGGTLLLSGNLVDEFGNAVDDPESGDWTTDIAVRSNVASDVIGSDSFLGDAGFVGVTFPHASVHRLSVSAQDFTTSFDVQVTPAALPAPTTPAAPIGTVQHGTIPAGQTVHGRLAYTGTDSTSALPWALGLVLAGVGLIGARTMRRRRAQR